MPAPKGNKYAACKKPNSGRRPLVIEAKRILDMGLANKICNESLIKLDNTPVESRKHEEIKDFAIPFALKAIKQEATITLKTPKPLDDMSDILPKVSQAKP